MTGICKNARCVYICPMHTINSLFDEVIQMATPYCIKDRDMTLVRKLKDLQDLIDKTENA